MMFGASKCKILIDTVMGEWIKLFYDTGHYFHQGHCFILDLGSFVLKPSHLVDLPSLSYSRSSFSEGGTDQHRSIVSHSLGSSSQPSANAVRSINSLQITSLLIHTACVECSASLTLVSAPASTRSQPSRHPHTIMQRSTAFTWIM